MCMGHCSMLLPSAISLESMTKLISKCLVENTWLSPVWHFPKKRHHVDTAPKGGEMNANMVKPLCSWGGKWSLGNGSHTCVKMENSDCLSNLPPGTRSHWKLNPGDSHHKQLRTHTGKHGGLCWVYGAMGLWWIWTAPPSPCIPLAPINPIHGLMLFWAATIRLPICLSDLYRVKGEIFIQPSVGRSDLGFAAGCFLKKIASKAGVEHDKVKDRSELNELTFLSLLHRK